MEREFKKLCDKINKCKNTKELYEILDKWSVDPSKINDWIDVILKNMYLILPQTLPYVIECLYANDNKIKFFFSNMLIEETYETIPFITNLEQIRISKEKYELLLPTLVRVAKKCYNGVADCMYLILLNNDPNGVLLKDEQKQEIVLSLEDKLPQIYNFIKNNDDIPQEVYSALEILLDVSCGFISEKIIEDIMKINTLTNLNQMCRLFLIKTALVNNFEYNKKFINDLAEDDLYISKLYSVLYRIGKTSEFPEKYLNLESFAKSNMIDWLRYPTELGEIPNTIEMLGNFEENDEIFFIYKFTCSKEVFKDKGEMLGVAGGYSKNDNKFEPSGFTFSKFESVEEDFIKQAKEVVSMIRDYWKKQVNQ